MGEVATDNLGMANKDLYFLFFSYFFSSFTVNKSFLMLVLCRGGATKSFFVFNPGCQTFFLASSGKVNKPEPLIFDFSPSESTVQLNFQP